MSREEKKPRENLNIDDIVLHDNFKKLILVPPKYLRLLPAKCEPTACPFDATKGLIRPGGKEPPREAMLELMEFMTDMGPDFSLGDMRRLSDISNFLGEKNKARGRRLRDCVISDVDWETEGFYHASITDTMLTIACNVNNEDRDFLMCALGLKHFIIFFEKRIKDIAHPREAHNVGSSHARKLSLVFGPIHVWDVGRWQENRRNVIS
jgi:hypothetical protein